jgi:hypothetical protein
MPTGENQAGLLNLIPGTTVTFTAFVGATVTAVDGGTESAKLFRLMLLLSTLSNTTGDAAPTGEEFTFILLFL